MRKVLLIILLSVLLTLIPLSIIWLHLQFIRGLNPFLGAIITLFILVIAVFIYRLLFKTFKKYISFTPDVLFAIGLFSYLILICILQIYYGNSAIDIYLHDTVFVISYSYPLFFISIGFVMFAAIYHWFSKIFRRQMNNTLGYIHFWITFLSTCFLLLPMQYVQLAGMPRRYYDHTDWRVSNAFYEQNIIISITGSLLLLAQLLFLFNFCNSIFRGKRVKLK